jgi:hypothetical protein
MWGFCSNPNLHGSPFIRLERRYGWSILTRIPTGYFIRIFIDLIQKLRVCTRISVYDVSSFSFRDHEAYGRVTIIIHHAYLEDVELVVMMIAKTKGNNSSNSLWF